MIKCPQCNASHYREGVIGTTLMYYPPVIKDGVNINPDKNSKKTSCHCLECGNDFTVETNEHRDDYGVVF